MMMSYGQNIGLIYYLGVISLVTFLCFGIDKYLAIAGLRRIPEKLLWLLVLIGGTAGGLIGMQFFCHKRKKIGFVLIMLVILLAQVVFVYYLFWTRTEWENFNYDYKAPKILATNEIEKIDHHEDGFLIK